MTPSDFYSSTITNVPDSYYVLLFMESYESVNVLFFISNAILKLKFIIFGKRESNKNFYNNENAFIEVCCAQDYVQKKQRNN